MRVRHPQEQDFGAVFGVVCEADRAVIGDTDWTESELREEWRTLALDRDAWVIELDGAVAGYATFADRGGGRLMGDGYVHPAHRGRGVGATILDVTEARAREVAETIEPGSRVFLQNATLLPEQGDDAGPLYRRRGYDAVRHFWRMAITHEREPEPPPLANGVVIEAYDHDRDARAVHAAIQEAFTDHWQHRPVDWDEWSQRFERPSFDPTLWFVARDGDELAGAIVTAWKTAGDWGFVETLGVRRPWRGRGVGEALLRTAFGELWRRGEPRVGLGVDAESPTGATRLYERVGMDVFWRAVVWEKELRAGA